ncbi:dihydrolipoyl dehydrogenase [Sporosarcina obsidiansis]|uniref:dihydrolipoyl dehydrogenase n=1 Tax=Sporosarcina obsidiansis TaxID=2660748 RepID=UPI00129AA630|nr:dihydrolipoyl dehydrogenase [Sporosarcina obsidiansis]
MSKKIVIIGGGPGGYVAAIRAAQLGAEVHLIEMDQLGGTCLNTGCIPTKTLLHTAELFQAVKRGGSLGLVAEHIRVDWSALMDRKASVVQRLVQGTTGLLKANQVTVHRGRAELLDAKTVRIQGNELKALSADAVIVAVGSEPAKHVFQGSDLPGVIDSTEALDLPQVPSSMVIIGGGVIGVEFAALYQALGTKVTVVEKMPTILPLMDKEVTSTLRKELSSQGVTWLTGAQLTGVQQDGDVLLTSIIVDGSVSILKSDYVLVAVGRSPKTSNLGLEKLGVNMERSAVLVNEHFETNIPGVYAVGDCNGQIMLAHAASAQGIAAVEHVLGHTPTYNRDVIPSCVYTKPEIATVGLTEEQAQERKIAYKTGVFSLAANGKSIIESDENGFVKMIVGAEWGEILGVHIVGPRATDLIAEASLAINSQITVNEFITTIHPHPTVSEAMGEAALAVDGQEIHWPPRIGVR